MSSFATFTVKQAAEKPVELNLTLSLSDLEHCDVLVQLFSDLDRLFSQDRGINEVQFFPGNALVWQQIAVKLPIFKAYILSRACFYQLPLHWHKHLTSSQFPFNEVQTHVQYRHHPQRPPMPSGIVYERFDYDAQTNVSFRVFDIEKDLLRFARWMNDPRVAHFWEQAWSQEKLAEFAVEQLNDPHIIPLIGEFDGQPFGYVEAYWVAEDRLSSYYDVQPYDRGIHLLVGEEQFRGPRFFDAWMKAITHYLFIDDNRTQRIVLEPRSDNHRLFNRIEQVGYRKCFEFNFPHKRSALLMQTRSEFFKGQW
ncbi:acetyltransferase [Vibrio aestuarianus]|nr:acetyltransferase [Vibrio aestuarianus]